MYRVSELLLLVLAAWKAGASGQHPSITLSHAVGTQISVSRWCTADELLPRLLPEGSPPSPEWSTAQVVKPPYGCDCSFYKSRYFCPSLGDQGYPAWVPQAVADGVCKTVARSDLAQAPLPRGFKVLVYGNSHLRQVVEGLMCMFHEKVKTKRVRYHDVSYKEDNQREVVGDTQCRECSGDLALDTLRDHDCMSEEDQNEGCLCNDDYGEFVFENGATVHYYFGNRQENKSLSDALEHHGNVSWSWYDAVFANQGNGPFLQPESVLQGLAALQDASVPFFWLNNYHGGGDLSEWDETERARFQEFGGKHVKIDAMAHAMYRLTKAAVEHVSNDSHFCLPGPPDEMALLLVKMMWAVHFETRS